MNRQPWKKPGVDEPVAARRQRRSGSGDDTNNTLARLLNAATGVSGVEYRAAEHPLEVIAEGTFRFHANGNHAPSEWFSKPYRNPAYVDAFRAACDYIAAAGHPHVLFEGASLSAEHDGVIDLFMGSEPVS